MWPCRDESDRSRTVVQLDGLMAAPDQMPSLLMYWSHLLSRMAEDQQLTRNYQKPVYPLPYWHLDTLKCLLFHGVIPIMKKLLHAIYFGNLL